MSTSGKRKRSERRSISITSHPNRSSEWLQTMISGLQPLQSMSTVLHVTRQRWSRIATTIFGILLVLCAWRAFSLQVIRGAPYLTAANGNRIQDEVSYAPRGTIYDRHGRVLATNTVSVQLAVTPYLLDRDTSARKNDYQTVADIIKKSPSYVQDLAETEGLSFTRPLTVSENLSHGDMLHIEQALPRLPGFTLDTVPIRKYTAAAGLAHVLGYVGKVNKDDLAQHPNLLPTDHIGRTGVEATYDIAIRGANGRKRMEVDAFGRPIRLLANTKATIGSDLHLTIDLDLQTKLVGELRAQLRKTGSKRAAGVAVDPRTGEVLAMASLPDYDNNQFAKGISQRAYQRLLADSNNPLLNRTIAGTYPSGSTIKPLVAAAALQEGVINEDTTIVDRGYIDIPNRYNASRGYRFRGWRPGGLGPMDVRRALAYSSNIYFYTIGGGHGGIDGLGASRLVRYYRSFGLGQRTGIDLPGEVSGTVPDPETKQELTGTPWYLGDTYNISIGQGDLRLTPLQILMAHAAIANNGSLLQPHLATQPSPKGHTKPTKAIPIAPSHLQIVREGMHDMPYRGVFSSSRFARIPVQIAGKTGTAQASNPGGGGRPHGWFVAFAPYEKPHIALLVMIENVEGSTVALDPVVNTLVDYFD
jgi:penicillin-binding protein 2